VKAAARGAGGGRSSVRARVGDLVLAACVLAGGAAVPDARAEPSFAEPDGCRISDYRAPVPATLAGAEVLDGAAARELWRSGQAIFIDVYPRPPRPESLPVTTVWRDPVHESIAGAHWLPNVGYGVLSPAAERDLVTRLEALTAGDKSRRLVFFCERDCWMSWNAAKRALAFGYGNVAWFPDGTDAWEALGLPLVEVQPLP
jgi:PQQ-dependent catabolism-associated CXXCW motif protein